LVIYYELIRETDFVLDLDFDFDLDLDLETSLDLDLDLDFLTFFEVIFD
jgi:hypothetical protein